MELEVKHLAPYLPYNLSLQYIVRDKVEKTGIMKSIIHNEDETHPTKVSIEWGDAEHIWMFKPLLKPLSQLGNDYYFFHYEKQEGLMMKRKNETYCRLNELDFLFKNHFDVFGLIDAGLATELPLGC
jgi:hypothetical protein